MVAVAAAVVFHVGLAVLLWFALDSLWSQPLPPRAMHVALLAAPPDEASPPEGPPPEEIPPLPEAAETLASAEPPPTAPEPFVDPPPPEAAPAPPSLPPPTAKPKRRPHVAVARRPQQRADAAPPSEATPPPAGHDPSAAGVAVYTVIVDAAGHIRDIVVALSSGEPSLDEAGKGIIRENMAAEPPAPTRGGGDGVFTVTLRFSSDPH